MDGSVHRISVSVVFGIPVSLTPSVELKLLLLQCSSEDVVELSQTVLNFDESGLWIGQSALRGELFTLRLCRPLPLLHRTQARVAWKVVLCCSNRASICSLAPILLSQTRWIVMPCLRTSISLQPFVQTRLDGGSLFVYKHQSPALCFKHVWIVVSCLSTSISLQPCVSNTFGLWFLVWVQASVSGPVFQTRLDCSSMSVYMHQSPALCLKHV